MRQAHAARRQWSEEPAVRPEDRRPWLAVRRALQQRQRQRSWRLEVLGLLLVLVATIATVGWVGPRTRVELGGLSAVAVGLVPGGHPPHRLVGYTKDSHTVTLATRRPLEY